MKHVCDTRGGRCGRGCRKTTTTGSSSSSARVTVRSVDTGKVSRVMSGSASGSGSGSGSGSDGACTAIIIRAHHHRDPQLMQQLTHGVDCAVCHVVVRDKHVLVLGRVAERGM